MKAKVINVRHTDTGLAVHAFRPGEIVEVQEISAIPLNDGKGGKEFMHKEACCIGSDGMIQYVPLTDLEIQ